MSAPGVHANASPLKRALAAIEKLQARVEELEGARREPIAIVGLSCRFPGGADSPEAFWRLLQEGVDAVAEIPPDRWDADAYYDPDPDAPGKMATRWGAFLPRVDAFDPRLFGITPREAAGMDPQQRLLLELSWEALERAGIAPDRLAGTSTGVFVGIVNDDYRLLALQRGVLDELGAYFASGTANSVAAGRISYVLGFQGPAIAVDTACSSSLVAVHLAVQSLRAGECRMALAGGANVVLSPEMTIALSKYRMMAADGRCKAFDARADGFVRGEGGAVLVLKRLSDAQAAGDRILAVIRGSAINQDGPSSGLTAPNGPAQEAVLRAALADAGVAADAVGYVEAHGTGTSLGDPIEVQALDAVLGRDRERPLLIGSVKTNIGHLEGAAGVAGLVKAVLVLQHGEIPASLHFREPNPLIAWERMGVRVVAERTVWERGEGGSRIAGVSSFGFSGTNAHVVVEEWRGEEEAGRAASDAGGSVRLERTGHEQPAEMHVSGATRPVALQASGVDRPVQVLTLSARDEAALGELASRYAAHLEARAEQRFQDVTHTANVGRAHLPHRLAVLAGSTAEAAERLAVYAARGTAAGIITGRAPHDDPPEVVFLFTGQGSQYAGMGRELYESSPVFRSALERCAAALEGELEVPLLEVLYPEPGGRGEGLLERTEYTQPALFALEWSLAELWRSWGVEPSLVLGHSVGEYVAACVAGVLEVEEALRLVAVRGRLMGSLPAGGVMVAVFAPEARVREVVERVGGGVVSVAAVNAPESVVVSGAAEAVERVVAELVGAGVGVQRLRVSHAFHSALMDPVVAEFERVARGVRYGEARLGVVSNVTGEVVGSEVLGHAGYWARQLREAVRYADGVKALWARGQRVFVEVGPGATLVNLGRKCVPESEAEQGLWLSSLRSGRGEWETLQSSVAELYVRGVEVDWAGVDRPYRRRRVELPTYPFQRQRYWLPEGRGAWPVVRADAEAHPLLGRRLRSPLKDVQYEAELSAERFGFIADHRVRGTAILPATGFMEMALAAAAEHFGATEVCGGIRITDIVLAEPLAFPPGERVPVQTIITPESDTSASFRILSGGGDGEDWRLHASGTISIVAEADRAAASTASLAEPGELERIRERCRDDVGSEQHYADLSARGLDFGPALRGVVGISRRDGEALARVRLPDDGAAEAGAFHVHPALLDACLQAVGAAVRGDVAAGDAFLPLNVESYRLETRPAAEVWSHVTVRRGSSADTLVADVRVLDERGSLVAEVRGLMLRRLVGAPGDAAADALRGWLHEVRWRRSVWPAREELPSAADFAADPRMASYAEVFPLIEDLAADFLEEACIRLGWRFEAGDVLTADGLAAAWGVVPRYHRLLGRLLEILVERGVLEPAGTEGPAWAVRRAPRETGADARWQDLLEQHPAFEAQLRLVGECGRNLAGVLTGAVDPLALLFPEGSTALAERLYRESPQSLAINELVGRAARAALAHRQGGAPVRAIEIGAGTGSATAAVLPALADNVAEYVFTDISPAFFSRARERFAGRDGLRFAVFDIERDPAGQGFATGAYDLVVASNVLHATADVERALAHARALLAPGGVLLLAESIRAERWIDITFGLTDGWWRFTDLDLRPTYPLLSPERWRALLAAGGFTDAAVLPGPDGIVGQAVIVARAAEREAPGTWLVVPDRGGIAEAAADLLRDGGHRCVVVPPDPSPFEEGGLDRWLAEATSAADRPLRGVLYLAAADAADPAPGESFEPALRAAAGGLVRLVQELGRAGVAPPGLWVVTRGAQPVGGEASGLALAQAPLWGLAKVIRAEHPELRCVSVDLDPAATAVEQARTLVAELRRGDGEDHVGVRGGERYVARLARGDAQSEAAASGGVVQAAAAPEPATVALEASPDGVLEALAWRPARRRAPGPGEVEIRVSASGLNFRDVMNALGMRADPEPLGSECSGRIVAVGPGVTGFAPGDDVVAVASGGFASFAVARAALTARRPAALDSTTAAGVPIAYLTAHYALNHVARIAAGERVLIHAAAGGVGLAAVRLAQRAGAEVFATAGSPEKREFLRRLGVAHVMDSRTLDFAGQVLEATGGRGVDVVLNSLAGEFIPRSLDALAEDGRFLEIGKRGIWTAEQVAAVRPRARYEVIDLSPALVENPDSLGPLFQEIVAAVDAGELPALPVTSFPAERVSDAFRYMAQARHIGKVIVARDGDAVRDGGAGRPAPDRAAVRPDATYLIVGGTAGLGLETARWLVERGARNLVLMARREPSADARGVIQAMEEQGARVLVVQGDVPRADDVRRVLDAIRASMPPLRGIIQSAGVLEDRALLRQDWDSFARVLAPKVDGSWHLHCLTADEDLDFFVLYSSVAALMGPAGQGAHAAANAFLDALAHHRRAAGRPALSIGWGVWTEIGSAAARGVAEREAGKGVGAISPAEGLRALETVMRADAPQVAVMPMDWRRFLADQAPLWLSELRDGGARTDAAARGDGGAAAIRDPAGVDGKGGSPAAVRDAAASDGGLAARLAAAPRDRRRDLVLAFVHEQALRVIGGGSGTIDPRQPLNELGVDSLMAVELRNLLGKGLGVPAALPATLVFDHPTIDALTDYIAREVLALDGASSSRPVAPQPAGMIEEIEQLSDEEVERYFAGGEGR